MLIAATAVPTTDSTISQPVMPAEETIANNVDENADSAEMEAIEESEEESDEDSDLDDDQGFRKTGRSGRMSKKALQPNSTSFPNYKV